MYIIRESLLYNIGLTASGNGRIVIVVCCIDTEPTAGERFPQCALIGTAETIDIGLNPRVSSSKD